MVEVFVLQVEVSMKGKHVTVLAANANARTVIA
jgi:hypothetical protein